ncbi:unnamed protein product [Ostreobium quekettii]|uniref:Uncharacterized protein n=1 Tax=Ostreobium quekettii TaxID=121088 RepID=A0A8S1J0D3_9CHLO|nr:unnamed protein product [Ostreobium quekettii]
MLPAALRARFAPGWRHQLGRLAQAHPSLSRPRCAPPEPQLPDPGCSADGANLGPSAAGMDAGQLDVKAPLRDRPPRHIVELSDLMAWRRRAESHIKEVGDSLLLADGGPSASELKVQTLLLLGSCATGGRGPRWQNSSEHDSPCTSTEPRCPPLLTTVGIFYQRFVVLHQRPDYCRCGHNR